MGHPTIYPTGVTVFNPEKAWNGYTILPAPDKGALLIGMNGHEIRLWENVQGFPNKMLKKEGKKNGTENVDCTWTCSQKSAASKSQDDVSGSTGADFIGSAVYQ